ncbi:histidinol dehydrogenase [Candidatus Vidania fulgoroideorum]
MNRLKQVIKIVNLVKNYGDKALFYLTKKIEGRKLNKKNLILNIKKKNTSLRIKNAFKNAFNRIFIFHLLQKRNFKSWFYKDKYTKIIGQKLSLINKISIYIPGGKNLFHSSLLMNIIPALVMKIKKIFIMTPFNKIEKRNSFCYMLYKLKITKLFNIGGAQGVSAFSFGTNLIPKVDKIYGPGNFYVNTAKKLLFGKVGIDLLAGPSELLIISDKYTNKYSVLFDLFAQSEHDEMVKITIISNNYNFLKKIKYLIKSELEFIKRRKKIIYKSIKKMNFFYVDNTKDAFKISNSIAPEHLEILMKNSRMYLKYVKNAGSVFINSSEVLGDYAIGCNHVLPTDKTSKFSSPLGIIDYIKYINISELKNGNKIHFISLVFSKIENLFFHNKSIKNEIHF